MIDRIFHKKFSSDYAKINSFHLQLKENLHTSVLAAFVDLRKKKATRFILFFRYSRELQPIIYDSSFLIMLGSRDKKLQIQMKKTTEETPFFQ